MIEVLAQVPVEFDLAALLRRAHVTPGSADATTFEGLVKMAREVARPKALVAEAFVEERGEDTVTIAGVVFTSRMLRANLDQVERVFPFIATCGHEMDEVALPDGEFMAPYWWDEIKAATLNCATTRLLDYLQRRFRLGATSAMHPGSADVDVWPIEQQRQLFAIFGDVQRLIGVELTPSCLMLPNKSVSGIRFATETDFRSCQVCRREGCPSRAAEFDPELWGSVQTGQ